MQSPAMGFPVFSDGNDRDRDRLRTTPFDLVFAVLLGGLLVPPAPVSGESVSFRHLADLPSSCAENTMTVEPDELGRPYLYVAAKEGGLKIYRMAEGPELIRSITGEELSSLDVMNLHQDGSYLYLALGDHFSNQEHPGMAVVDVGDPAAARVSDLWLDDSKKGAAGVVRTEGDHAYLGAMRDGLVVLDISDRTDVSEVSRIVPTIEFPEPDPDPRKYNARGLDVRGDEVYLAYDAGGFRVIDVADPTSPREVGRYSNPVLDGQPRAYNNVALDDRYAYVTVDYCGLEVLDISDPTDVEPVSWWNPWNCDESGWKWFDSPGHTNEIAFARDDELLFLSTGKSDLNVISVADPAQPRFVGEYGGVANDIGTWGVGMRDDRVYLSYICTLGIPFSSRWSGVKELRYFLDSGANAGLLSFEGSFLAPLEADPSVELRVARYSGSDGAVSVSAVTVDGEAEAGADYRSTSETLSWGDGETGARTVEVELLPDDDLEGGETFEVRLEGATGGATIQNPRKVTVKILDDEGSTGPCVADETTLCLNADDRFRVEGRFRTSKDEAFEPAKTIPKFQADSGILWFFDEDNAELLVKALDVCVDPFDSFWLYYAATTDVEFELTVTDTETGVVELYRNPPGEPADVIRDTRAFPVCDL